MKKKIFLLLFLLSSVRTFAQDVHANMNVGEVTQGMLLDKGWKFFPGDEPAWSQPEYDDSDWTAAVSSLPTMVSPPAKLFKGNGWFRLHFTVDTSMMGKPIALVMVMIGSADVYLDGNLIQQFGIPGDNISEEKVYHSKGTEPVMVNLGKNKEHLLAVRYSSWHLSEKKENKLGDISLNGFSCKIADWKETRIAELNTAMMMGHLFGFLLGFFAALCFLHTFLYIFYRKNRSNLYYSAFSLCMFWICLSTAIKIYNLNSGEATADNTGSIVLLLMLISLTGFLYSIFYEKIPKIFWVFTGLCFVAMILRLMSSELAGFLMVFIFFFAGVECIRVVIRGIIRKTDGAWVIGTGVIIAVLFPILCVVISFVLLKGGNISFALTSTLGLIVQIMLGSSVLSISVSMSIYLARQFARTNKGLELQMVQVKELSAKTIAQEQEKKKILESQNEILESQVTERTAEVVQQKKEIEEKSEKLQEVYKDIRDSIHYAKRIQEAMLPAAEIWNKALPDSFILFKPKDIVSGDFYWLAETKEKIFFAAADCTGHGVPGAFMSMLASEKLHEAVEMNGNSSGILKQVNRGIKKVLRQSENAAQKNNATSLDVNDGMDIALCALSKEKNTLNYSGANRPLWIVRKNGELEEIKATKAPIGGMTDDEQEFEGHDVIMNPGDTVYIFSDGYADQFSKTEKKLMTKRFREIILSLAGKTMTEQRSFLDTFIENWKGDVEQVDDILVIGIKT
ncbi:MAG: SpoIIE family protein phosphatase [Bacteroidetes bacterium]|nr:SpoIIE family protein phosphatase [Bacteroidota bacterium]